MVPVCNGVPNRPQTRPEFRLEGAPKLLPVLVHNYVFKTPGIRKLLTTHSDNITPNHDLSRFVLPTPGLWIKEMRGLLARLAGIPNSPIVMVSRLLQRG